MSNLKILLRNNVKCLFGALQGKKSRKKMGLVVTLCVLACIGISVVFGFQIFGLFQTMAKFGLGEIPLFNSFQIMLMILVILAFQSMSEKTQTNDSDLLLSMPIRKVDIILSKTLSKYLFNLVLLAMIMFPTIILYSIYIGFSIGIVLWCLLLLLILPLLGVGLNYILNFLIIRLFNRLKHAQVYKTIFILLLFGGFLAIYIYNASVMGLQNFETIDKFLNSNFFIGWCVKTVKYNSVPSLIYLLLLILSVFALGVWGYSATFGKSYVSYNDKNKRIKFSSPSAMGGLLKKELKKYFSTPIFLINTLISPIIMIVLTVYVAIKGESGITTLLGISSSDVFAILTVVYLFLTAMTLISCCTVSLEGRYLWILRSTPSNVNKILLSKSLLNIIIFLPIQLITSIILCIVFHAGINQVILFLSLPALLNIILSFGGVYINLLLPKLEWESEAQVVKQSASILVTMIIGIVLAIIPVIFDLCNLSVILSGYLTLGIYIAITIIALVLLFVDGKKRFNKLAC